MVEGIGLKRAVVAPRDTEDDPLDAFLPLESEPRLILSVEPPRATLGAQARRWAAGLGAAALLTYMSPLLGGVAVVLPALFVVIAFRMLIARSPAFTLRFDDACVELVTWRGWTRVTWDRVTSLVEGVDRGGRLETERGVLAFLPPDAMAKLLEADVLPPHVEIQRAPPPQEVRKNRWQRTLLLWFVLVVMMFTIYQLVASGE